MCRSSDPVEESGEQKTKLNMEWLFSTLFVNCSLSELIEIAQQLPWITACFQIPVDGQVSYSEAHLVQTGVDKFENRLVDPIAVQQRGEICGLPLFENGIIARDFPVPDRRRDTDIELPFSVMTGLANIMSLMYHAQGVCLRSFSKILFPSTASSDMSSVQWHLMTSSERRKRL